MASREKSPVKVKLQANINGVYCWFFFFVNHLLWFTAFKLEKYLIPNTWFNKAFDFPHPLSELSV